MTNTERAESLTKAMIEMLENAPLDVHRRLPKGPTRAALIRRGIAYGNSGSVSFGCLTLKGRALARKLQEAARDRV